MNDAVVYRAAGIAQVVYQPSAQQELYIPAIAQLPGPGQKEVLLIPASRPSFTTIKEAWEWHLDAAREAFQIQHMQIDQQSITTLDMLERQVGPAVVPVKRKYMPVIKPLIKEAQA